jgi:guanylate kinase
MILVLVGKSSSGKDTLMKELVNNIFTGVISTTSRPIREYETADVNYHFTSVDEFINKIKNNEFIEYRTYNTKLNDIDEIWYYGTEKNSINTEKDSVLVLDVQGLKDIKKYFPNEKIIGIYLHCPLNLRTERAKNRGSFCVIEWNRRIQTDKIDFENVYEEVDYVLNGTKSVKELADEVKEIIDGIK